VTRAIRGTCTHRFLGTGEAPRCLGLNGMNGRVWRRFCDEILRGRSCSTR
jgi:hypothetical protein